MCVAVVVSVSLRDEMSTLGHLRVRTVGAEAGVQIRSCHLMLAPRIVGLELARVCGLRALIYMVVMLGVVSEIGLRRAGAVEVSTSECRTKSRFIGIAHIHTHRQSK